MFPKSSVLFKFYKYSSFKDNGLGRMLNCEYGRIIPNRGFFTKIQRNVLLIPQKSNIIPITAKNHSCFKIACNMSSSKNEGSGEKAGTNEKEKKSVQTRRNIFRRRSKLKAPKKPHMNCTRCNTKKLEHLRNERLKTDILTKGSNLPHKKVHVEFMESQNLKDFDLNSNNAKKNVIKINIEPRSSLNDQTTLNIKPTDINKALISFKNLDLKKSSDDLQKMLKDRAIENTTTKNNNSLLPEKNANEVSKKSANIRVLYHAHPRRKTKIRIPKHEKSQKIPQTRLAKQQEQTKPEKSAMKTAIKTSAPLVPQGIDNFETLYSTESGDTQLKMPSKAKLDLEKNEIKLSDKTTENSTSKQQAAKYTEIKEIDPSKPPTNKIVGTATLETTKLTKPKRPRRGGSGGNSSRGDGGDDNLIKGRETISTNARPSRFWRSVFVTIMPLTLGLIVYAISNIGAAETFKRMSYAKFSDNPLSKKILPVFHGNSSKNKQLDLNETESDDED